MGRVVFVMLVTSLGGSSGAAHARKLAPKSPVAWPNGDPVAVSLSAFAQGFHFCSRVAPHGMSGFWEVPGRDLPEVDAALLRHLRHTGLETGLPLAPSKYERQYLGFRRGGDRFIYVNAFAARFLRAISDPTKEMPRICDGGSYAWGIEYDVKHKSFAGFAANLEM